MEQMKQTSRRSFLKTVTAGAAATTVAGFPHVARAQTKLTFGLWDHWVPGANDVLKGIVTDWGKGNRVDITIDFITSIGNKLDLTSAAEYRAGAGHDIIAFGTWYGTLYKSKLVNVSDVVETQLSECVPRLQPCGGVPASEPVVLISGIVEFPPIDDGAPMACGTGEGCGPDACPPAGGGETP